MNLFDKNQTLQAPEGYTVYSSTAVGAYLRLEYRQSIAKKETGRTSGEHIIVIFLNDQGREVMRSTEDRDYSSLLESCEAWSNSHPDHVQASNKFWATIKSWIRRIRKCLKKSQPNE